MLFYSHYVFVFFLMYLHILVNITSFSQFLSSAGRLATKAIHESYFKHSYKECDVSSNTFKMIKYLLHTL